MAESKQPEPTLIPSFAEKVAGLTPEAWERIHARCSALDGRTFEGFLNRMELVARAVPDSDPYQDPLTGPFMAMLGRFFGVGLQVSEWLSRRSEPDAFERTMRSIESAPRDPRMPYFKDCMRVHAIAHKQASGHPGTAAALRAITFGLLWQRKSLGPSFAAIYQPFEPEIPLASLTPAA